MEGGCAETSRWTRTNFLHAYGALLVAWLQRTASLGPSPIPSFPNQPYLPRCTTIQLYNSTAALGALSRGGAHGAGGCAGGCAALLVETRASARDFVVSRHPETRDDPARKCLYSVLIRHEPL